MRPSNFIFNTDYASVPNDSTGTLSIALPASYTIYAPMTFSTSATLGSKAAGMRIAYSTTADPNFHLLSSICEIPCTETYNSSTYGSEVTVDAVLTCWVYRSSSREVMMNIIPNYPGDWTSGAMTINLTPQTITAHISTFLSPFK